jgi:hypothetical protein
MLDVVVGLNSNPELPEYEVVTTFYTNLSFYTILKDVKRTLNQEVILCPLACLIQFG